MKKSMFLSAVLMGVMFILAACGGGNASDPTEGEEKSDKASGETGGSIIGDGSSTVFPIMEIINEEFNAEHGMAAEIGVSGTGAGFERFTAGETDFQNASRDIKEEEITALEEAGIEYTEFLVGTDGLTIAVSQENDFVDSLTFDELYTIYSGEAESWSDVREDFPDEPITAYGPDQSHGTHDFFKEEVMNDEDVQAELIQDTNQVVSSVNSDPNSIGFFGYSFYLNNEDTLKAVPVQGPDSEEAIEPTDETVQSYQYPLSRPLYVYAKNESLENNEDFRTFMEFTLENAATAAQETGYVALPEEDYQEQIDQLP
ncbi:MAG TPA: phosphate ABC transporter substrate-binding protein PstS family protein [Candidatus Salinicoccus stercoripullorum]|uniref:Phosphate-binding protein n=1 Tax=Candidatus Salinicoccus stercoripullorum TaxID=2838756 RepID=A0A9D1QFS0_9STAP|nr:phosphate ABC transporter substrate-binding protein PstS family protein [Candidatus Salinicoccus stercoripullorum]